MKGKRYSEEKIIAILKEHEAGVPTVELVRRHGVSEQSIYRWKTKYGGMEVSEAKRLRELEEENRRLKRIVADLSLDKQMLEDVLSRNVWSAPSPQVSFDALNSLHKCIRPLASGLLLQPGHDEIRTPNSYQVVRARSSFFWSGLSGAVQLLCHQYRSLQTLVGNRSGCHRHALVVGSPGCGHDDPGNTCQFVGQCHTNLV